MKEFNILTPGEKIKNIRTKFDIRQEDITGGEITRNLISIIENNKANLTESVAKTLAAGINNICKERNIDFCVSEDYLLEDVVSQAKKIADTYIEYINNLDPSKICLIEEKLNEIDVFLKTFPTEDKKVELYRCIGKKLLDAKLYNKSFDYYLKAFESSTDNTTTTNILIKLGLCCTYLSQYNEALNYYKLLLDLNNDIQPQYLAKYNIALCYKKLGNYNEALKLLDELKQSFITIKPTHVSEIKSDMLMAICLYKLNSFNKAISIYKDLLRNVQSLEEELLILNNLADVYRETKDYCKLNKICSKINNKLNTNQLSGEYLSDLCSGLARNYIAMNDNSAALPLLLRALESYKNGQSTLYLEDLDNLFIDILNIYISNNDEDNIDFLKNEFFELIVNGLYPRYNKASLKFIQYYNNTKNSDKINIIVDFLAG